MRQRPRERRPRESNLPAFRMRVLSVAHGNDEWEAGSSAAPMSLFLPLLGHPFGPQIPPLPPPPARTWFLLPGYAPPVWGPGTGLPRAGGERACQALTPCVPGSVLRPGPPCGTSLLGRGLSSPRVLGAQSKAGHSVQGGGELSLPLAWRRRVSIGCRMQLGCLHGRHQRPQGPRAQKEETGKAGK